LTQGSQSLALGLTLTAAPQLVETPPAVPPECCNHLARRKITAN